MSIDFMNNPPRDQVAHRRSRRPSGTGSGRPLDAASPARRAVMVRRPPPREPPRSGRMPTMARPASSDPAGPDARTGTQAIERAVAVLTSFDDVADLALSDLAARAGLSMSTTHRIA